MIRVVLPSPLRAIARVGAEFTVPVHGEVTVRTVVDAIEAQYPMLRGTIRDHGTKQRRAFVRFFACEEDWSLRSSDDVLPARVADGSEPLLVVGAMAGG
jgi:hypothetical protein